MKTELLNLIKEHTSIQSSTLSMAEKTIAIKNLSSLLQNELYLQFSEAMGSTVIEDYELFKSMGDNLLNSSVDPNEIYITTEHNITFMSYKKKKKQFLSALEISKAFLDTASENQIKLFTIFISNESDLLRMNLLG